MKVETYKATDQHANMPNYETARENLSWEEVSKQFSWYETGKVNMAYELIDRHVDDGYGDKIALHYKLEDDIQSFTFKEIQEKSNQAANVLKDAGVKKGDRVFIFMARSPELYFSLLGALKIGAVVGPLFEAFMEKAVKDRLENSDASTVITSNELIGRIPVDELPELKNVVIVGDDVAENYIDYRALVKDASVEFDIEWLDREDGLILHYTSGSTGQPKGVLHVQEAMVQQYISGKYVLDLKEDDVYWCTADPGWVTGTSYGIFAPWLNRATNVIVGGRFSPESWYGALEALNVTVWYSAPTAFRMLMGASDDIVSKYDLSSLRHVLSVGEPLNPEVVKWGMDVYRL